jgi:large subunit ribosomal protein L17
MPHQVRTHKLSRPTDERTALFRSLTRSVILHGRIQTTESKARAVRPVVERVITLGRRAQQALEQGDTPQNRARALHYRRLAFAFIQDDDVLRRVFSELALRYKTRPGGYTRIVKLGYRKGDAAPIALLELV